MTKKMIIKYKAPDANAEKIGEMTQDVNILPTPSQPHTTQSQPTAAIDAPTIDPTSFVSVDNNQHTNTVRGRHR